MEFIIKIEKSTPQTYFEKNFQNSELKWKNIYTLPRRVTISTNLHMFQYKLFHNFLYLNEMLYKFGKKISPLYSFCMDEPENPIHLFHFCAKTNFLWM